MSSSAPYSIEIVEPASSKLEKLKLWRPSVIDKVVEEIETLAESPTLLATPIAEGPLKGEMHYRFTVSRPPGAWTFTVLFRYTVDERAISIYDIGVLKGDPPRLVDPPSSPF